MDLKGEMLFQSFDEAASFVNRPTQWEQERNIVVVEKQLVVDVPDFKVLNVVKSDKTSTMFIFFKNSRFYDIWKFWCPSESQVKLVGVIPFFYDLINSKNKEVLAK